MSLGKNLKGVVLGLALGIGISIGVMGGFNLYAHHNVNYEADGKRVFERVDGILAFTQLKVNEDGLVEKIGRYTLGTDKFYTDEDGDEKVDRISEYYNLFVRGPDSRILYRDEDFKKYPKVFERADQDFKQQVNRFKPYINKISL